MEVPVDGVIIVLVNNGNVLGFRFTPSVFVVATFPERSDGADNCDFGMCLADAVNQKAVALEKHFSNQIFVANLAGSCGEVLGGSGRFGG